MFDRFDEYAKGIMNGARRESQSLSHGYIGTEHILLGLLGCEDPRITDVLTRIGTDPKGIEAKVREKIKSGDDVRNTEQIPFTPPARRVLELSLEHATQQSEVHISPKHILYALFMEDRGIAAQTLKSLGVRQKALEVAITLAYPPS